MRSKCAFSACRKGATCRWRRWEDDLVGEIFRHSPKQNLEYHVHRRRKCVRSCGTSLTSTQNAKLSIFCKTICALSQDGLPRLFFFCETTGTQYLGEKTAFTLVVCINVSNRPWMSDGPCRYTDASNALNSMFRNCGLD